MPITHDARLVNGLVEDASTATHTHTLWSLRLVRAMRRARVHSCSNEGLFCCRDEAFLRTRARHLFSLLHPLDMTFLLLSLAPC